MENVSIYTLADENGNIRYIGKSCYSLENRLKGHIKDSKRLDSYKDRWVRSILNRNKKPIIELLDSVPTSEWEFWEKFYINQFKVWGFNLVNRTEGGDGVSKGTIPPNRKEILQYTASGKFIKEWASLTAAADKLKVHVSGISAACSGKKDNKAFYICGGFRWKYKTDNYPLYIEIPERQPFVQPVLQYDISGNFICEWESIVKARQNVPNTSEIVAVCNGRGAHAGGFQWRYKTDNYPMKICEVENKTCYKKKVIQYSLKGDFIKEWNSSYAPIKFYKNRHISECCNGKHETASGFIWKFKNI